MVEYNQIFIVIKWLRTLWAITWDISVQIDFERYKTLTNPIYCWSKYEFGFGEKQTTTWERGTISWTFGGFILEALIAFVIWFESNSEDPCLIHPLRNLKIIFCDLKTDYVPNDHQTKTDGFDENIKMFFVALWCEKQRKTRLKNQNKVNFNALYSLRKSQTIIFNRQQWNDFCIIEGNVLVRKMFLNMWNLPFFWNFQITSPKIFIANLIEINAR